MFWSKTLIPTLRDDPGEAEIPSHKLMLRAGLLRKLSSGLYTFLPLGFKALKKVELIVREEMDKAGAMEVLMPALQPREIWETSDRYKTMGASMFRLKDRQQRDMVLGPTHEEVITELVSHELNSYKQLPKTFYQIQTKFRDEIRPRFGLMRAKEFIMKDAYSFDIDINAADASYKAMYDAYVRIFERCGLRTKVVEADTGAIGGKWSHEFMVLADTGEDGIVECTKCEYAANLERAERAIPSPICFPDSEKAIEEVATPGMKIVDEVSGFFKCDPKRIIKTIIYLIDGNPAAVCVSSDRDINEHKLARILEAQTVVLADAGTILKSTSAEVGYAGPVGLKIPVYADLGLRDCKGMISGANKNDTHLINVCAGRDFQPAQFIDIGTVKENDLCPRCSEQLREKRGIEVGHVFKLGTKYSEKFNAIYLDAQGQKNTIVMGCYGIGVTRTLQSIIEQSFDENGIIWPLSVAPYQVVIDVLDPKVEKCMSVGLSLMNDLEKKGIDVILDDRDERPGVKFKDADLVGFPIRVVVGARNIDAGKIEIKLRKEKKADLVDVVNAVETIYNICKT